VLSTFFSYDIQNTEATRRKNNFIPAKTRTRGLLQIVEMSAFEAFHIFEICRKLDLLEIDFFFVK